MSRWARILKHRWFDETDVAHALDAAALKRLQARVTGSELHHSGEIRVCVEAGLPLSYLWRHASARQRALTLFGKLRVWDTEHNNGVLIYLLLAERAIELVADRGLMRQVPAPQWQALVDRMRTELAAGKIEDGLIRAITEINGLLCQHFPLAPGQANPNELPDSIDLR